MIYIPAAVVATIALHFKAPMLTIRKKIAPTWFAMPGKLQPAPEFLLAPLTSADWLDVRNQIFNSPDGEITMTGLGVMTAVRAAVRDWRNVFDEKQEQLPFSRAALEDLPSQVLLDIATEIVVRSTLSENERKN